MWNGGMVNGGGTGLVGGEVGFLASPRRGISKMDGSTVHFPARAPQKIRAGCLLLTRESRGGFLVLGRDGRGKLGGGRGGRSRVAVGRGFGSAA